MQPNIDDEGYGVAEEGRPTASTQPQSSPPSEEPGPSTQPQPSPPSEASGPYVPEVEEEEEAEEVLAEEPRQFYVVENGQRLYINQMDAQILLQPPGQWYLEPEE